MSEIDDIIAQVSPYYTNRKKKKDKGVDMTIPSSQHQLIYNSSIQTLEPVYFWILDFVNGIFRGRVEKIMDNFASSPGSGHFAELQGRVTQMQQQAMTVLSSVNGIIKGVINVIYDLKEWQILLSHYDEANSKDKKRAEAGLLALKQRWMDKVDMLRGQGSINALSSGQLQFVTLRDAFMAVNSIEEVEKLDLNERVKRILKPRIQEFFEWKKRSEAELRKRFEIEKIYLKSQVDSLKLYTRWAKPYLKAAQQLQMSEKLATRPELVNIFNTVFLQLTLLGKNPVDVEQAVIDKNLPEDFKKMKKLRKYNSVVVIDFNFRGIPSRMQQGHFVFGGRVEVTFKAYTLNDEELALFKEKLSESDLNDSLKLIQGMTDDSLQQIKVDLDEFLKDKEKEEAEKVKAEDINPFSALFSFLKPKQKTKEKGFEIEKLKKGVKKDSYAEQYLRNLAEADAINSCYNVFDVYKKAHEMVSLPYIEEAEAEAPKTPAEELFGFKPKYE